MNADQQSQSGGTEVAGTESREARHWIERQLRWERTLTSLRDEQVERQAA